MKTKTQKKTGKKLKK